MKSIDILVADPNINESKCKKLISRLEELGYSVRITLCRARNEIKQHQKERFDITFIDYNFIEDSNKINLSSDKIYIITSSEDTKIPRYAAQNRYNFLYKPFNIDKVTKMITA